MRVCVTGSLLYPHTMKEKRRQGRMGEIGKYLGFKTLFIVVIYASCAVKDKFIPKSHFFEYFVKLQKLKSLN